MGEWDIQPLGRGRRAGTWPCERKWRACTGRAAGTARSTVAAATAETHPHAPRRPKRRRTGRTHSGTPPAATPPEGGEAPPPPAQGGAGGGGPRPARAPSGEKKGKH
eukprot:8094726-Pyramimonas_sp.AAC.1